MDELDEFLDERVGSDPDLLPDLLDSLTKERDELEQQASRPLQNSTTRRLLATRSLARGNSNSSCVERWQRRETTRGRRWCLK